MYIVDIGNKIRFKYPSIFRLGKLVFHVYQHMGVLINHFLIKFFAKKYYLNIIRKDLASIKIQKEIIKSNMHGKLPASLIIELNNTCNLNCPMCETQSSVRTKGNMSLDLFESILKKIIECGLNQRIISLHTVGEPLFYKNLERVFELCNKYGFRIHLTTNGQLIDKWIYLFEEYPELVTQIYFSIDSPTEQTYEKLRLGGKFSRILQNLELIKSYNDNHSRYDRIPIFLNAVISNDNINEIPLFYKIYERYFTIDQIGFNFLSNSCATHDNGGYYNETKLQLSNLEKLAVPCAQLWSSMTILYNGDVSICCRDYNGELIVGNIQNNSLEEIWNNKKYSGYRKMHASGNVQNMPYCKDCYTIMPEVSIILNNYIRFLFHTQPKQADEFYVKRILNRLELLNEWGNEEFFSKGNFAIFFSESDLPSVTS